jgi:hypothetical protein
MRATRRTLAIVTVALALSTPLGALAESPDESEARAVEAAEAWLAIVDAGDYGKSWDEAAKLFRGAVTKEAWERAVAAVRTPLGEVTSRTVKAKAYRTSLPGAPDGHYVVIQFDTSFANKREAVETVTPMLDADGAWRVSGYYVR